MRTTVGTGNDTIRFGDCRFDGCTPLRVRIRCGTMYGKIVEISINMREIFYCLTLYITCLLDVGWKTIDRLKDSLFMVLVCVDVSFPQNSTQIKKVLKIIITNN